jgi:hypothetical protein
MANPYAACMPRSIDGHRGPRPNLHTVYGYGQPLGVECRACGHRALAFADQVEELRANMTELHTLRFVCQACGSRDWAGWLLVNANDTAAFIGAAKGPPAF